MAFLFAFINLFSNKRNFFSKNSEVNKRQRCRKRRQRETKIFILFSWHQLEAGLSISASFSLLYAWQEAFVSNLWRLSRNFPEFYNSAPKRPRSNFWQVAHPNGDLRESPYTQVAHVAL